MEKEVETSVCPKCDTLKSVKEFGLRSGGKGHRRNRWCRECCAESVRRVYANSLEYRQSCKDGRKRRCLDNHRKIYQYLKEHSCIDCGETDPVVLQFDHLPGQKRRCVTGLTAHCWEAIQEEISKCEITCANCHSKRTAMRANTVRWQLSQEALR